MFDLSMASGIFSSTLYWRIYFLLLQVLPLLRMDKTYSKRMNPSFGDWLGWLYHGWSGEGLKLEVETYYLKRVYSVSSDFSRFDGNLRDNLSSRIFWRKYKMT